MSNREQALERALRTLLARYEQLVDCGDCGNWNPREEAPVIAGHAVTDYDKAREVLAKADDGKPMSRMDARDLTFAIAMPALELAEAVNAEGMCGCCGVGRGPHEDWCKLAAFNDALRRALAACGSSEMEGNDG